MEFDVYMRKREDPLHSKVSAKKIPSYQTIFYAPLDFYMLPHGNLAIQSIYGIYDLESHLRCLNSFEYALVYISESFESSESGIFLKLKKVVEGGKIV